MNIIENIFNKNYIFKKCDMDDKLTIVDVEKNNNSNYIIKTKYLDFKYLNIEVTNYNKNNIDKIIKNLIFYKIFEINLKEFYNCNRLDDLYNITMVDNLSKHLIVNIKTYSELKNLFFNSNLSHRYNESLDVFYINGKEINLHIENYIEDNFIVNLDGIYIDPYKIRTLNNKFELFNNNHAYNKHYTHSYRMKIPYYVKPEYYFIGDDISYKNYLRKLKILKINEDLGN